MKKKIAYATLTAIIGVTAFFVGKNFTEQPMRPETKAPETQEIADLTVTEHGLMITFEDNTGVWLESEDLERAGLISTANIVDWNTDGKELSVLTENDYEYYAYKEMEK